MSGLMPFETLEPWLRLDPRDLFCRCECFQGGTNPKGSEIVRMDLWRLSRAPSACRPAVSQCDPSYDKSCLLIVESPSENDGVAFNRTSAV